MKSSRLSRSRASANRGKLLRRINLNLLVAITLVIGVSVLVFLTSAQTSNQQIRRQSKPEIVPGELLVRFRSTSEFAKLRVKSSRKLALSFAGRAVSVDINGFEGSELVEGLTLARFAPDETIHVVSALSARSDVLYAEPNYVRYAEAVPNDTHYSEQFALKDSTPGGAGISAESAWNTTHGSNAVVVGVIDSGFDTQHLDLKDNVFINTNDNNNDGVDDDGSGVPDDVNGWDFVNNDKSVFDSANDDSHGTHVAGTIGARGNNAIGVAGVNWNVQLMSIKVLGPSGGSPDSRLIQAYTYAKTMRANGVNLRVLNNSYGAQGFSQALRDAVKALGDAGILFVAAAGNETMNNDFVPTYPASLDLQNVISVAASSKFGQFASSFSNKGPQTVHIAAPGEDILSTTPRGYSGQGLQAAKTEGDGSTYSLFSGTSMASPHVAGTAALAIAANPGISLEKLRASVLFNGDENGAFGNIVNTGARLNAFKTVEAALEPDTTAPAIAVNFRINSQNGRRVELRWSEAGDDGSTGRAAFDEVRFIDSGSGQTFRLNTSRSQTPGTERTLFVSIPFKHPTGQLTLKTFDNVGNNSTTSVSVTVAADVSDPYIVTLDSPAGLTTLPNSGTALGVKGDDTIFDFVTIPFPFPFFGSSVTSVSVSSNGALYVPIPPDFAIPHPNLGADDGAIATAANLESLAMIAGMWADLRTDRNASDNVYMVSPDRDTVIFRWQAVTFGAETPANFEIELRRDGTIKTRYGTGNQNLLPVVVGISGGDPESYLVPSHTSESAPLSLSNAQGVTFALRNPPPPPTSDLSSSVTGTPNPVVSGQNITYVAQVTNLGPSTAEDLVMTDPLPAGTTFVSCTSSHISATCTGPAVGTNGTVTGRIATLQPAPFASPITFTITANVTAAPNTTLQNSISATSFRADPNPANNSASVTTSVVAESFFAGAQMVAAGRQHTTSVKTDGTVWNWGTGSNGQLGNNNAGIGVRSATPVQVSGLEGFTTAADGNGFALALKSDGTVWGWGSNGEGQLGDGTTTQRSSPVKVSGLTNVVGISAGSFYAAAVKTDGTVWIWGGIGSLGFPPFPNVPRTTPEQLASISNVTAISAGGAHILMLKSDKTVWAVGANSAGQLGDGTTTSRLSPVQVNGLTNVSRIGAGKDEFSIALKEDGTVWAWGINFHGELGPNGGAMNFDPHPNPIQVTGLPAGMTNISVGQSSILALAGDGTVWSWGNNGNFQLGQGSQIGQNPIPQQIPNFTNVTSVAAGYTHGMALKADGSLWGWGSNSEGEIGDGTTSQRFGPVRVSGLETVASPSFNPPAGSFTTQIDVTVTCATAGATIHFTTNGNEPTESDPIVASGGTVHISSTVMLRAKAWKPGSIASSSTFAQYNINIPTNPIDGSQFFVTQQYDDFLGRTPDPSGLAFWINNIEVCGFDPQCRAVKRIDTSAAFFLSIEFQQTGYLVYRFHKVAYGNLPSKPVPITREMLLPDMQKLRENVIVGQGNWEAQLETNKQTYSAEFVSRPEFLVKYPQSLSSAAFVDALHATAGGNVLTPQQRDDLVNALNAGTINRGQVVRAVAENPIVGTREFNPAFVLMQYFGYLRRNPDNLPDTNFDGYNFWLNKLNQFGDFRNAEMVKAFITSNEYRHRFGP